MLHQDPPALWDAFRSTEPLDSSQLTWTNLLTEDVVQPSSSFLKTDRDHTSARFEFDELPLGKYALKVRLPDGQRHLREVEIADQTPQQIELNVPRERYRYPVLLSIPPLPDDLKQANSRLSVQLTELPLLKNNAEWRLEDPYVYRMGFNVDGSAGWLQRPKKGMLHYGQSPQADNPVLLTLGPVRCRFRLHVTNTDVGYGMIEQPMEEAEIRIVEVKAKDGGAELEKIEWHLELPEKFLAAARKQLADAKESPADGLQEDEPEDRSALEIGSGQVTMIAKRGTPDGPAVPNLQLSVHPMNGGQQLSPTFSAQTDAEGKATITDLEPGRYKITVGMHNGGCSGSLEFRVQPHDKLAQEVVAPEVKRIAAKITASLPKELEAAGLRVCVLLQPESPTRNGVRLHVYQPGGLNWRTPYLVDSQGTGLLQIRPDVNIRRKTQFSGRLHWSEDKTTVELPDVRLHVASLSLIGPSTSAEAEKKAAKTSPEETLWEVYSQAEESSIRSEFLPLADQPQEWHIRIPDEMIFAAERKLQKSK